MRQLLRVVLSRLGWMLALGLAWPLGPWLTPLPPAQAAPAEGRAPLYCVAFSPYVEGYNPDWGPHPSVAQIGVLLDRLLASTPFRCIMTYGVLPELEPVYSEARARGLKVIAIVWLDDDREVNRRSIAAGVRLARAYRDTIVRMSCGSEVRTRHGQRLDGEIERCLRTLRQAGVTQPLTTIDTWWQWCDATTPCRPTRFAPLVDWIGANIFPWWEDQFSPLFECTSAAAAPAFHLARLEQLRRTYPGRDVVVTEFGWPKGPTRGGPPDAHARAACARAGPAEQLQVVNDTLAALARRGWSGVVFEAFCEPWKVNREGSAGPYWGLCDGRPPYTCPPGLHLEAGGRKLGASSAAGSH